MILLETDKIERALKEFKLYFKEVIIVGLVYVIIFQNKSNDGLHKTIEKMQHDEIINQKSDKMYWVNAYVRQDRLNDSIIESRKK